MGQASCSYGTAKGLVQWTNDVDLKEKIHSI